MTSPSPISAVILDFDGVIIESNDLKTLSFREVFSQFPAHVDEMMAFHDAHVSESRYEKFRHLAALLGRTGDEAFVDALADDFTRLMQERALTCPWVPGAEAFLERFSPVVPLYLVSATPQAELDVVLRARNLTGLFQRVYGCPPWTKNRAVREIIASAGGPQGVAFVGDSAGDQRVARDCGVDFIGRNSGLAFDTPIDARRDMHDVASVLAPRVSVTLRGCAK